ncbi:putative membrane protein [Asticcacaulis biprosthecium C19]|uniref:Putative membrane protein n=1 Tax=Asticcacaulis biprosthecium C19 TaxID=715226 RepID=F4QH35_9CAUL|nr:hypothetical protein [Asticcacaulis biprosthecium]EGF92572.1 putative membrane protein [Asticcacaulis biprosthecium C19]
MKSTALAAWMTLLCLASALMWGGLLLALLNDPLRFPGVNAYVALPFSAFASLGSTAFTLAGAVWWTIAVLRQKRQN